MPTGSAGGRRTRKTFSVDLTSRIVQIPSVAAERSTCRPPPGRTAGSRNPRAPYSHGQPRWRPLTGPAAPAVQGSEDWGSEGKEGAQDGEVVRESTVGAERLCPHVLVIDVLECFILYSAMTRKGKEEAGNGSCYLDRIRIRFYFFFLGGRT